MEQFEKFNTWYMAVVTAIISSSTPFLYAYLNEKFSELNGLGCLIATVLASVIFVEFANWIAKCALNNSSALRRMIMGRNYFEGTGVDFSFDPNTNEIFYGTITRYYYKNFQVYAEANVFDKSGEIIGDFNLKSIDHDEHGVRYGFWGIQKSNSQHNHYYGYGEMRFGAREGAPKSFYGFYIDNIDFKEIVYEGNLLDKKTIASISNNKANRKRFLAKEYERFATRKAHSSDDFLLKKQGRV